jgi:hypothetical protein
MTRPAWHLRAAARPLRAPPASPQSSGGSSARSLPTSAAPPASLHWCESSLLTMGWPCAGCSRPSTTTAWACWSGWWGVELRAAGTSRAPPALPALLVRRLPARCAVVVLWTLSWAGVRAPLPPSRAPRAVPRLSWAAWQEKWTGIIASDGTGRLLHEGKVVVVVHLLQQ